MCLLLPRVCFIQDISRDLFREDFGPNYIALGIHFGTHLEKNSVRFEESVLERTLDPFWNCFFGFLVLPASPEGTPLEAFSVHVAIQRRPEVEN